MLVCPFCVWFEMPFEGLNCQRRFGVNGKSTVCDEHKTCIPPNTILMEVSKAEKPKWGYVVKGNGQKIGILTLDAVNISGTWHPKINKSTSEAYSLQCVRLVEKTDFVTGYKITPSKGFTKIMVPTKTDFVWQDNKGRMWKMLTANDYFKMSSR